MKTKFDLTKYENMYDSFDGGHNRLHLEEVRNFGIELGKKYAPDKLELIWVAATLHDVGLSIERENHEFHSYEIISADEDLKKAYSPQELEEIYEAVREHRASTGNPQCVVAKIVSDSDKVSNDIKRAFQRAYAWGVKHHPKINHEGQLYRASQHLMLKFGPNGTGSRLYFEESKKKQDETYQPIFDALDRDDYEMMEGFLK